MEYGRKGEVRIGQGRTGKGRKGQRGQNKYGQHRTMMIGKGSIGLWVTRTI
jgi:hypothetical protein